jgi:hypothetical protein
MIVLLILASWIVVLAFVTVLCVAARRGEEQNTQASTAARRDELPESITGSTQVGRHRRSAEPAGRLLGARGATG